jgi:hypothetical protein
LPSSTSPRLPEGWKITLCFLAMRFLLNQFFYREPGAPAPISIADRCGPGKSAKKEIKNGIFALALPL